jgi:hypothetical protein
MEILTCKKCESTDIEFSDKEGAAEDTFKCNDCGCEFTFSEANWKTEF